jgi:hypothetical protein
VGYGGRNHIEGHWFSHEEIDYERKAIRICRSITFFFFYTDQ